MTPHQIIFLFGLCWFIASLYVMKWHTKKDNLDIGTFLLATLLGPILAMIIYDSEKEERRRKREEKQRETGDRQRRWFRMNTPLNRNAIPDYGRTIPPPPPISRINLRDARAEWQRQNGYNNIHNFKFFRSNVKNREQ